MYQFALSDTILKHVLSSENKAVDCLELTKIVCTLGPGAHFCAPAPCTKCEHCMTALIRYQKEKPNVIKKQKLSFLGL